MERKNIAKYLRATDLDVTFVNEAINRGAYLTMEEWHDFTFKSCLSSFKSKNLSKYHVACPIASEVAQIEAFIFGCIMDAQMSGFTISSASRWVKAIVKRFNKMLTGFEKISFVCSDIDGVAQFVVESCDGNNVAESYIDSRDSLCDFLHDVWAVGVKELRCFSKVIVDFLCKHLHDEVNTIENGKLPVPHFGGVESNTLRSVIFERTDYNNAKNATPADKKEVDKPLVILKASGQNG